MALHGCSCSLSLPSVSALPPAKTQISSDYSGLHILRSPCATLNPPLPVISSLSFVILSTKPSSTKRFATRATTQQNYVYPDPIPEFAEAETLKFKVELMRKLSMEKEKFGGELDEVVSVCTEIFSQFLLKEYGGPGTLLVEPFTDMLVVLKEKRLAGAAPAARASLLWAQNHLDQDWQLWTSRPTR